jgi:hypothetical protein
MGSRSRRPVLGGPTRLFAAAFVALCLLPTCSSREAHDTTRALGEVGSARDGGGVALETPATASALAPLSARASPRRALAQTPDASASASADPDAAASVTASDLAALAGYVRDDVDDRVVILTSHVSLDDGESLPPVEKTISIRGACGSSNTDACVIDAKSLTRHVVVGAVGSLTLENVVLRNGAANVSRRPPPTAAPSSSSERSPRRASPSKTAPRTKTVPPKAGAWRSREASRSSPSARLQTPRAPTTEARFTPRPASSRFGGRRSRTARRAVWGGAWLVIPRASRFATARSTKQSRLARRRLATRTSARAAPSTSSRLRFIQTTTARTALCFWTTPTPRSRARTSARRRASPTARRVPA